MCPARSSLQDRSGYWPCHRKLSGRIANGLVPEVFPDPSRRLAQFAQVADGCAPELLLAARRYPSRDRILHVGIQVFVRVRCRAVAGQIEHLDLGFLIGRPEYRKFKRPISRFQSVYTAAPGQDHYKPELTSRNCIRSGNRTGVPR